VTQPDEGWFISSHSESANSCVEVRRDGNNWLVRNSNDRAGPVLRFNPDEWAAWLAGVKAGEFD
jgi:uncharacterized protein DUF397